MIGRFLPLGLVVAGVLGARLAVAQQGSVEAAASLSPLACPLLALSGQPCPTCGMGRSLVATANLDFVAAWGHHPFGPIALIGAVCLAALLAFGAGPSLRSWSRTQLARPAGRRMLLISIAVYCVIGWTWNF